VEPTREQTYQRRIVDLEGQLAQRDRRIAELEGQVIERDRRIAELEAKVGDLKARIAVLVQENARFAEQVKKLSEQVGKLLKNSSNSSKPPCSDIVKPPKPPAPRGNTKRKIGGQAGHPGEENR